MLDTSFSNIPKDYYISNKKIYLRNNICYTISNDMKFDAEKFAEWMKDGYANSPYKTITSLAETAESNKATISRLMSGASQTLTSKPSQPNKELVKKLAIIFNKDINEGLLLAGYAPDVQIASVPKTILSALAREGKLSPDDENRIADFIIRLKQE